MKKRIINKKYFFWSLYFLCYVPFVNKGVDVTDTSYYLNNYKYMFSDNEVARGFGTIFTNLIGGILYNLVSNYQLLFLNFLGIFAFCASGIFVYKIFEEYDKKNLVYCGIFAANLLAISFIKTLNYNILSSFFFHIGVYLLVTGLFQKKQKRIFFSGLILAINIFVRFPNILHLSVGIAFLIKGLNERKFWKTICEIRNWCLGIVCGIGIGIIVAIYFIDINSIFNSLKNYSASAGSSSDVRGISYGIQFMYGCMVSGFKSAIKYIGVPLISACFCQKIIKKYKIGLIVGGLMAGLFGAWFVVEFPERYSYLCVIYFIVYFVLLCGMLLYLKKDRRMAIMCGISLAIAIVGPFGSDTYLQVLSFYSYLPICVTFIFLNEEIKRAKTNTSKVAFHTVLSFLIVLTLLGGSTLLYTHVYRDASYNELTEKLDENFGPYAGMVTSEKHKKAFESTQKALDEFSGKELLFLGDYNAGCLISETDPFFSTPWPDLMSFNIKKFKEQLERKKNQGIYPVILIADKEKFSLRDITEKEKIVKEFMKSECYRMHYQDEYITVYIRR